MTGSMTVNGKKTEFHHVTAIAAPSMFHEDARKDLVIVFSNEPVTASEILDSKLTGRWMDGKLSALLLRVQPWDKQVVSGNLWAGNLAKKGQQISGNNMAEFAFTTFDPQHVAGHATQKGYGDGDPSLSVDAMFDAPIEGGPLDFTNPEAESAAAPKKLEGKPLPAGGGEPGAAYLGFVKALHTGNIDAMRKYLGKPLNGSASELKEVLPMLEEMSPKDSKVTGGTANATEAEVEFTSAAGKGVSKMMREKDGWKFTGVRPQ